MINEDWHDSVVAYWNIWILKLEKEQAIIL
jgi:hypothetical protein